MNPRQEPLDHEERALARLLSGDDAAVPDAAVDIRILAAARQSPSGSPADAGPMRHRPGATRRPRRRWPVAVGLAASVTLAVGVAWQLREPPRPAAAPAAILSAEPAADATPTSAPVAAPAAPAPAANTSAADIDTAAAPEQDAAVATATAQATRREEKAGRQAETLAAEPEADTPAAGEAGPAREHQVATAAAMQRPAQREAKAARQAEALAAGETERERAHQAATAVAMQRSTQRTEKATRQALAPPPPPPVAEARATAVSGDASPPAPSAPMPVAAAPVPAAEAVRSGERHDGFVPDPAMAAAADASDLSLAAAANVVEDDARLSPSQWLQRIRERSDRGETALARASLARFVEVHPQEPVPADLRPLLP